MWYYLEAEAGKQCTVGQSLRVSFPEAVNMEVDGLPQQLLAVMTTYLSRVV